MAKFSLRQLELPGKTVPSSVPLILPSTHEWNSKEAAVITKPFKKEESGGAWEQGSATGSRDLELVLIEDTVTLLQTIRKPLAVLSICGPYRSGKSYFLSRVLGKCPGVFQLGHTMRACTIGLWISTIVLECEDYIILLVDTQGIDSISASESVAMNLMTITALLSSYFIYNSKKVPQNVDVEKLRICSLLSSVVLGQVTEAGISDISKSFYPQFMWLLRDVTLNMTDGSGQTLDPTTYLHTRVLKLGSDDKHARSGQVGREISSFFRSLECRTLPMPTINGKLLQDIFHQQEKLNAKFNRGIASVIDYLLQEVNPKRSIDGNTLVDGPALTELVSAFVDVINIPDILPNFQQGWLAQIKVKCMEIVEELAEEYHTVMVDSVSGNLPLEENDLIRIHKVAANKKQMILESKLHELDPLFLSISKEETAEVFEQRLAVYDTSGAVIGGALYEFITENFYASKSKCEALWSELVRDADIRERFNTAIQTSSAVDVTSDLNRIEEDYLSNAVGPAKLEVLEKNRKELLHLSTILHKLPGEPFDLKVIGVAYNKVKLSWSPPLINPEAVDTYRVQVCMEGSEWRTVKETSKTTALITGLLDSAKYRFGVSAASDLMKGLESYKSTATKFNETKEFVVNLASGAFPVVAAVSHIVEAHNRGKDVSLCFAVSAIVLTTMLTPVTVVGFPLAGPLLAVGLASDDQMQEHSKSWGDLTPEDD